MTSAVGLSVDVAGLDPAVGEVVSLEGDAGSILAEVVALHGDAATCMPVSDLRGVRRGSRVVATGGPLTVPIGPGLLGRVLDGLGRPIDGGPPLRDVVRTGVEGVPPTAMSRARIDTQMGLGVRALDTLVPCGRGQRIGIFAGSGVGKSSTAVDDRPRHRRRRSRVLALVGERGREVREFVEHDLGPEGLARSVVVVATSDEPALVRLRAAFVATRIAEWFRDSGEDVVLLMDSAHPRGHGPARGRAVGRRAAGDPRLPAVGLRPAAAAARARRHRRPRQHHRPLHGPGRGRRPERPDRRRRPLHPRRPRRARPAAGHVGPLPEHRRAGVDLAQRQRRSPRPEQRADATVLRRLLAAHRDAKELVEIGAYVPGTNPLVDRALARSDAIDAFLRQGIDDVADPAASWAALHALAVSA